MLKRETLRSAKYMQKLVKLNLCIMLLFLNLQM